MGIHADLIEADLEGIDPGEMAEHLRAVASLTERQLSGMLGWAQQEQDGPVYDMTLRLSLLPGGGEAIRWPCGHIGMRSHVLDDEPDGPYYSGCDCPSEDPWASNRPASPTRVPMIGPYSGA